MKKQMIGNLEVYVGSGNVFADLGLPDADSLKIKSGIVMNIEKLIRQLGLTHAVPTAT